PGDGPDERPGGGDHVAIAALARLLEHVLAALAEFGEAPQVEQRPEAEDPGCVQLPDDPGAPLAEDGLGPVEPLERREVAADEELGGARRAGGHAAGVRMAEPIGP